MVVLLLISFAAFSCVLLWSYLFLRWIVPDEDPSVTRLHALNAGLDRQRVVETGPSSSFIQRILSPLSGSIAERVAQFAPSAHRQKVADKLSTAGGLAGLGVNEYFLLTIILGLVFPLVVAWFSFRAQLPMNKIWLFSLITAVISIALPFVLLNHKLRARRHSMQRDLPDMLDLLTVSVEAGLGFDGALHKLSEKMKGALVDEFTRMLNEMRVGVPRREALTEMGRRCNLADIYSFTMSMVQADQLGVSIGNVLRVKSKSVREKQRQRAEELAMKAPVKMLMPLIFFIFPTVLVVLLGPALLKIVDTFGGM